MKYEQIINRAMEGGETMTLKIEIANLEHAFEQCEDPDCEIHHPEVGIEEGTVSLGELAFFVAGAESMKRMLTELLGEQHFDPAFYRRHDIAKIMEDAKEASAVRPEESRRIPSHEAQALYESEGKAQEEGHEGEA